MPHVTGEDGRLAVIDLLVVFLFPVFIESFLVVIKLSRDHSFFCVTTISPTASENAVSCLFSKKKTSGFLIVPWLADLYCLIN